MVFISLAKQEKVTSWLHPSVKGHMTFTTHGKSLAGFDSSEM